MASISGSYLKQMGITTICDCFDPTRNRIRCQGADYLLYCLIDGFFPVLEDYGECLEELEKEVVRSPSSQTLEKIYQIKRELLMLRCSI